MKSALTTNDRYSSGKIIKVVNYCVIVSCIAIGYITGDWLPDNVFYGLISLSGVTEISDRIRKDK